MSDRGTDSGIIEKVGHWKVDHVEPAAYAGLYEGPIEGRIGVCCSGGGIRSAAFNLGALQCLQAQRVLKQADYLSAVSGGSYIASAFCTVAKTWEKERNGEDSHPGLVPDDALPFHPGSPEEHFLRNHLAYLASNGFAKVHLG